MKRPATIRASLIVFLILVAACSGGNDIVQPENEPPPTMSSEMEEAIYNDDVDVLERLLEDGASVESARILEGATALQMSAAAPDGKCLRLLLERGADPNVRSANGMLPIATAAAAGQANNVEVLIEAGSRIDLVAGGMSALQMAALGAHSDVISVLLDNGADPLAPGVGRTALHQAVTAAESRDEEASVLRLLLDHLGPDADIDVVDNVGWTPLTNACRDGSAAATKLLLEAGADPDFQHSRGPSILWYAVGSGSSECVELLLEYNVDVAGSDYNASSLLHQAAEFAYPAVLRQLLETGKLKVNATNGAGNTPLHLAAGSDTENPDIVYQCVKLLLDHGADKTISNVDGDVPADVCVVAKVLVLLNDDE